MLFIIAALLAECSVFLIHDCSSSVKALRSSDEEDFVVEFLGLGMSIRNPIAAENRLKVQILSIKQQEEQKKLDDIQKDFE